MSVMKEALNLINSKSIAKSPKVTKPTKLPNNFVAILSAIIKKTIAIIGPA